MITRGSFVDELTRAVPESVPVVAEHLADHDGLLLHLLMGDLVRLSTALFAANDLEETDRLLHFLGRCRREGDVDVVNAVVVSFVEDFGAHPGESAALRSRWPDGLRGTSALVSDGGVRPVASSGIVQRDGRAEPALWLFPVFWPTITAIALVGGLVHVWELARGGLFWVVLLAWAAVFYGVVLRMALAVRVSEGLVTWYGVLARGEAEMRLATQTRPAGWSAYRVHRYVDFADGQRMVLGEGRSTRRLVGILVVEVDDLVVVPRRPSPWGW